MAAVDCPTHGPKFAIPVCPHVLAVVEGMQATPVYLRRGPYAWHTLCAACVRRVPASFDEEHELACVACVSEWAEATQNGFVARANHPVDEWPPSDAEDG